MLDEIEAPSRWPTTAGACRRTGCTCSGRAPATRAVTRSTAGSAPVWSSARAGGGTRGPMRAESAGVGCDTRVTFTVPVAEAAANGDAATHVRNRSDAPARHPSANAHPCGRRRPADAARRPRCARGGGFVPLVAGEPGEALRLPEDTQARADPAGSGATPSRRHRVDGAGRRTGRPAGRRLAPVGLSASRAHDRSRLPATPRLP